MSKVQRKTVRHCHSDLLHFRGRSPADRPDCLRETGSFMQFELDGTYNQAVAKFGEAVPGQRRGRALGSMSATAVVCVEVR